MIVALYSYTSQSGKDTVADFIENWARMEGKTVTRSAFADEMKVVCADALGMKAPREHQIRFIDDIKLNGYVRSFTKDPSLAVTHHDGRDFIIGLAESIRRLDPMFWIQHAIPPEADVQLITDLRFTPEAREVRWLGGKIISVFRPDTIHRNEDELPDDWIDQHVINNADLETLELRAFAAMDRLFPVGDTKS